MDRSKLAIFAVVVVLVLVSSALALISLKYALVFVAATLIVAVLFFKPFYGLLLYLALLYIRPQDFVPELARLRVILVLATVIVLFYFVHKIVRREEIAAFSTREHVLMFILLIMIPISHLANFRLLGAWDATQEFLTLFLLFFLIVSIPNTFEEFRTICWMLFACTAVISANGIIQHFRGVDLIGQTPVVGRIRWIGLFGDPNELALLINSFFPFVLMEVFDKGLNPPKKIILSLIGLVMVAAIYFTNSRGGFIAFLAILLLFAYKRWGLLRGIAIGSVFLVAGLLIAPSRMGEMDVHEVSASARVNAWTNGLILLKTHPVFGIGFKSFFAYNGVAAHSAFIECVADLGVIGYFVWLTLLYSAIAGLVTFEKRFLESPYRKYASILQLSFVGFIGSALFLSQAYSPVLYILAALATFIIKSADGELIQRRTISMGEAVRIAVLLVGSLIFYKLLALVYY